MILESQTLGDSFEELEDAIYEAASVYGLSETDVDQNYQIDFFGDIVEIQVNTMSGSDDQRYEDILIQFGEDLDLDYNVAIL